MIGDTVGGVGLVLVGEGLVVPGYLGHRLVVGDHPEPAVVLVEHHRAALPQLVIAAMAIGDELQGLMIDIYNDICCLSVHARSVGPSDCPKGYEP